jgi:hypothetical protein
MIQLCFDRLFRQSRLKLLDGSIEEIRLHVFYRLALNSCFLLFLLTACTVVRPLDLDEQEAIRQNKKAVVLFRLTGSLDKKEVRLLRENIVSDQSNYALLSFGLANLDVGEALKTLPVATATASWAQSFIYFSPSSEAAENGWGAFLLESGTYYLRITSHVKGILEPIPEFRFVVPPNAPLVYIGSLHVACTTVEDGGWFGGRKFYYGSCLSDAAAADEAIAAKQVAQASFRDFGPPSTMIMQRYNSEVPPGTISTTTPLGLLVPRGKIDVGSPDWIRRAIGIGLLPSALFSLGASGPGVAAALLWAPVGAALGYAGGKWSESKWEPCRQALQESLSAFDPMAVLGTKLKSELERAGMTTIEIATDAAGAKASDVETVLIAQIQGVMLRFCSPTLCLEMVTRVRLFEPATESYLHDRAFVYLNSKASTRELQPYESLVTDATSGRDLETYCGEGGGEILQRDFSKALDATVRGLVQNLDLSAE